MFAKRWLLIAAIFLSACTATPHRPTAEIGIYQQHLASLNPLDQFSMQGRIGVQSYKQGFSGRFNWQHQVKADEVALYSPLGSQVATIKRDAEAVSLVTSDRKTYSARDAETLTEQNLGWRLPMSGLNDWALGRPSPASPSQATWDDTGKITHLNQDGWEIEYSDYRSTGKYELPYKIYLKGPQINLKLIVEQWDISRIDTQGAL